MPCFSLGRRLDLDSDVQFGTVRTVVHAVTRTEAHASSPRSSCVQVQLELQLQKTGKESLVREYERKCGDRSRRGSALYSQIGPECDRDLVSLYSTRLMLHATA